MEKQFCICGYKSDWYEGKKDREPCPKCRRVMYRLIDKDENLPEDSLEEVEEEIKTFDATLELANRVVKLEEQLDKLKQAFINHLQKEEH
jgi:uncharacterized protein Yka (UPF0111/DUF47 family)